MSPEKYESEVKDVLKAFEESLNTGGSPGWVAVERAVKVLKESVQSTATVTTAVEVANA